MLPDINEDIDELPDISHDVHCFTLRAYKSYVTTPEDGRDHVILRIRTDHGEHFFSLARTDFFKFADHVAEDARLMMRTN